MNTSPLPALLLLEALLLDSPLLEALLLASPLLLALPLGAPPAEALLVASPPPAPLALDEPDVGSATEPQAESHAPAITTRDVSVAARRCLLSGCNGCLFINAFPLRAPRRHGGVQRSASPTGSIDRACARAGARQANHAARGRCPEQQVILPGRSRGPLSESEDA